MGLEELLKPAKWLDEQILREYTKIGQKIPDEHLYDVTMVAFGLGIVGVAAWLPPVKFSGITFGIGTFPDLSYNIDGLLGRIKSTTEGGVRSINRTQYFNSYYNRVVRLPIFLTGLGTLDKIGSAAYSVMNGEPSSFETMFKVIIPLGFLSLASSMYLKDQNPKLLDKQPFWKTALQYVKEKFTPEPTLEPVRATYEP